MRKGGLVNCALFVIYLIVSLPLCSSIAFADYFSVSAFGMDELSGFRKSDDITVLNATASIVGGGEIGGSQLKLVNDPTRFFNCVAAGLDTATCTMIIPEILVAGVYSYQLQMFKSDNTPASVPIDAQIIVDDTPAKPAGLDITSRGTLVNVTVGGIDTACAACPPTVCSGVGKIAFLVNNALVKERVLNSPLCVIEVNSTSFNVSVGKTTENRTICVEVYDRLGQKSSECKVVLIDGSPPTLVNMSVYKNNKVIRFTPGTPENVEIRAVIKDDSGIDFSSFVVDFSVINKIPQFSDKYKNIDNSSIYKSIFEGNKSCHSAGSKGLYECTWKNLVMVLPEGVVPNVKVSFSDIYGNVYSNTYTLPIVFDNVPPRVLRIVSQGVDDLGRNWVGKYNNTIRADIEEIGSGFEKRQVVLDVGDFGEQVTGSGKVTMLFPNNCSTGWSCVWNFINVTANRNNGDILTVNVVFPSQDDAGNIIEGNTISGMYLDLAPPQIINITGSSVCPVAGDTINLIVNVTEKESGMVKVSVVAPNISLNVFPQVFDCEKGEGGYGDWVCEIVLDNLPSYYVKDTINITVSDLAGNKNSTTFVQEVCESAPGAPPNLVSYSDVDIFPEKGIDKMVAGRIAHPLFFQPHFTMGSGTRIQKVSVDSCGITGGTVSDQYVLTEFMFNDPLTSTKVSFETAALGSAGTEGSIGDTAEMDCGFRLIVRSGTKVFKEPEFENVSFEVPLHGTLFGEITATVQAKIDGKNAEIATLDEEIDDLQGWVDVLGTICTIAELVAKFVQIFQIIHLVIYILATILDAIPFTKAAGQGLYKLCPIFAYLSSYALTIAWQPNTIVIYPTAATSPGFYLKIICAFVTCRFYNSYSFVDMIANAGSADGGEYSEEIAEENTVVSGSKNRLDVAQGEPSEEDVDYSSFQNFVPGNDLMSPYKSLPVAEKTLCAPGELYGLKKERQVKCMTRNCYRDYVAAGFSPEICDRMEAVRTCLYVDSAVYRAIGLPILRVLSGILEWWLTQVLVGGLSMAMTMGVGCPFPYGLAESGEISQGVNDQAMCGSTGSVGSAWKIPVCSLLLAAALWMDVGDWLDGSDFDWNYYDKTLDDPDYCSM
jgi:hypothetical protein